MTVRSFIDSAVDSLSPLYDAAEAKAVALRLLEAFDGRPSYKYIAEPYTELREDDEKVSQMCAALDELCTGRPLQYVLGYAEFCGHRFKVREGCLIPRPETEELVNKVMDACAGREIGDEGFNILDICTGSGCIAYSLAYEFPEAMVYGCDVSNEALSIACRQRIKLKGASPVIFFSDVLQAPPAGLPMFDVIVSNPPYIAEEEKSQMRTNVLDYEPSMALFVPDDNPLLFYKAIARWADTLLRPGGTLFLEINERFGCETASLFPGSQVFKDINGKDRFVVWNKE
ncbi:MAG: peptide chain release factor N(5)-glutamine methyltransferase [Bacteroidales bacterium]|nr:peptide chain release factor N(5)-glutamine methyltransferase [Candidatus Cacconaster merdequi]